MVPESEKQLAPGVTVRLVPVRKTAGTRSDGTFGARVRTTAGTRSDCTFGASQKNSWYQE